MEIDGNSSFLHINLPVNFRPLLWLALGHWHLAEDLLQESHSRIKTICAKTGTCSLYSIHYINYELNPLHFDQNKFLLPKSMEGVALATLASSNCIAWHQPFGTIAGPAWHRDRGTDVAVLPQTCMSVPENLKKKLPEIEFINRQCATIRALLLYICICRAYLHMCLLLVTHLFASYNILHDALGIPDFYTGT